MAVSKPTKRAARPAAPRDYKREAKLRDSKRPPSADSSEATVPATAGEGSRTKIPELLAELEAAAKQLDVRLSYDAMSGELGAGGLCKVKGQWRVIIDKRSTPGDRLSILALALSRIPRDGLTLSPKAEKLLREVRPKDVSLEEEPLPSES